MNTQKYTDSEADFWKEHFVHLQHKNMVKTNAQSLRLEDCKKEFEAFSAKYKTVQINTEYFDSYCTLEIPLTQTIKLRLFIQSSIKGSLMQKAGNDFVKLCDAKFPYNPLPEIGEFLEKVPDYLKELNQALENKNRSESRQKLVLEFIKAYAKKQLPSTTSWEVIKNQNGTFTLTLHSDKKKLELSEQDFVEKINKLN